MAELPSGTVTFLFTDIEGSTRLLKELRDGYAEVLLEHQGLLRSAFEEGGGQEIDAQGDAFFFVFRRARDAVGAAAAAQRALAGHSWPKDTSVRVRMGIHSGEPVVGGDRYVGLGVHRAARICAAAHGGQVLLSNASRELIEDDLPPDLGLRDLGEQKLKDIDRAERLYQLVIPDLPDEFPPLRTPAEPAFSGREGELAAAAQAAVKPKLALISRLRIVVPLGLLLAAGILVGALVLTGALGGGTGSIVASQSLGVIDPVANKVVGSVDLPNRATDLRVGDGSVWVADGLDGTVLRVGPKSRRVEKTIGVGFAPQAVTVGKNAVWVAQAAGSDNFARVREIDPATNQPGQTITLDVGNPVVTGLAVDDEGVWLGMDRVYRIEARTGSVHPPVSGIVDATAMAPSAGILWVTEQADQLVTRVDPTTEKVQLSIPFGSRQPSAIAVGAGAVWVADEGKNLIWRIDPVRNEIADTIPVGRDPADIAFGEGAVWVANRADGTISRIDPKQGKVVSTIKVGKSVDNIAAGEGAVWVSVP